MYLVRLGLSKLDSVDPDILDILGGDLVRISTLYATHPAIFRHILVQYKIVLVQILDNIMEILAVSVIYVLRVN